MTHKLIVLCLAAFAAFMVAGSAAAVPGDNSKYTIIGAAFKDKSPTNSQDQVVRFTTTPGNSVAGVIRKLNQTVGSLDGLLSADYYFVGPKTCGAGSPRYSLFIDDNANGVWESPAERAVFGYIDPGAFGTGCVGNAWKHENLTDDMPRWDLTQFGGPGLTTWDVVKAFFAVRPGNDMVVFAKLIEDSCSFSAASCGTSYYDTIEIGDRNMTLENWSDTSMGCSKEFESAFAC